ncbi:MAG: hypothetical protein V1668_01315 [Patescibacteria group bacterium]
MYIKNVELRCLVLEFNKARGGLILTVLSNTLLPYPSGYPVLIVVPCEQRVGHTYHGQGLLWIPFAQALAESGVNQPFVVHVTGEIELVKSLALYPQQPKEQWPTKPTLIIKASYLNIE